MGVSSESLSVELVSGDFSSSSLDCAELTEPGEMSGSPEAEMLLCGPGAVERVVSIEVVLVYLMPLRASLLERFSTKVGSVGASAELSA